MTATTRLIGMLLIVLGIGSYTLTGRTSLTAMIPAFFGAVFIILAWVARNEAARKHAMHVAVAVGLIGAIAPLTRAIRAALNGNLSRPSVMEEFAMSAILAVYVALGVRSFIAARRARRGQ